MSKANAALEKLQQQFAADIARLNEQQRMVVATTEGPMFVVSGPGTGKTTMVTLRIAHLLNVQDVNPQNILCFSFTNAACTELRSRLEKRIGGVAAHKVGVYTFHAFANEVLMQHLDYLGIRNLRTISDLEKIEITKSLIDSLPTENVLRRLKGDEYFEVARLTWLSQVMREEGWNFAEIGQKIADFVESLPNQPEYQYKRKYTDKETGITYLPGDPNPRKIEEVKRYMQFTQSAIASMPVLQQKIAGQGYYDYSDMIAWATAILSANEGLRRFVQERYQYIIVDEVQDTSGSQLRLLELLLEYWMPNANVLMVGDPDQMIMGFQGAHAHSQQQFLAGFAPYLQTVNMDNNYRSTSAILQAAHSVICQNEDRLRREPLTAAATFTQNPMPQVRQYANPTEELAHIAGELQTMHRQGKDLSEVFCLFAKHRLYEQFILALDGMGIPYRVQRPIDVLSHRTAQMALTIFEYIAIECDRYRQGEGEHLLFQALHFPFIGVSHADVSRITRYIWNHAKPRPSWFTVINNNEMLQEAGCADVSRITAAGYFFGEVMAAAFAKASVTEIYRTIMQQGGLLQWVMQQPDALLHLDILNALHRFLDEQTQRKPYLTSYDLVQTIADMRSENLRLDLTRTGGTEKGVQVMTLHAAKGMEADTVYMIGCRKDLLDDTGAGKGGSQYKLPPTITRTAWDDGGEQERRKLFYVGMTRARQNLIISYSATDAAGKDRQKSRFVGELLAHGYAVEETVVVPAPQIAMYQAAGISTVSPSANLGNRLTDEELDDMLRGYRLSPTHLNIYLNCPQEFYLNYVLRVPRVKNMYAAFGSAVDEALRELHRIGVVKNMVAKQTAEADEDKRLLLQEMLQSKYGEQYAQIAKLNAEQELETLLGTFEAAMQQQRGYFPSQTSWENRMAYGRAQLQAFYAAYRPHMPAVCQTGFSLNNVYLGAIPLTGEIDNLVWVGKDEVRVEDWKTGSPAKGAAKVKYAADLGMGITPEIVADGAAMGEYRRQLYFYKIMLEQHSTLLLKPIAGKVRFIESHETGGQPLAIDVPFDAQEQALVENQIAYAYKGIMSKQFNRPCNDPLCPACKFVAQTGIVLPGITENVTNSNIF